MKNECAKKYWTYDSNIDVRDMLSTTQILYNNNNIESLAMNSPSNDVGVSQVMPMNNTNLLKGAEYRIKKFGPKCYDSMRCEWWSIAIILQHRFESHYLCLRTLLVVLSKFSNGLSNHYFISMSESQRSYTH